MPKMTPEFPIIGGPHHGMKIAVREGENRVTLPRMITTEIGMATGRALSSKVQEAPIEFLAYRLEHVFGKLADGSEERVYFWVPDEIDSLGKHLVDLAFKAKIGVIR